MHFPHSGFAYFINLKKYVFNPLNLKEYPPLLSPYYFSKEYSKIR
jgi:hypothetical protein